jgi:hypothetical protein
MKFKSITSRYSFRNNRQRIQLKKNRKLVRESECCFTRNEHFFLLYHDEGKLHSMRWSRCPLGTNARRLIFIVLAHWNNNPSVYMSLHSDTSFLIPGQQVVALQLECLVLSWDTANTNIIAFRLLLPGLELTIYCTRGEHCNNYTTYAAQIG